MKQINFKKLTAVGVSIVAACGMLSCGKGRLNIPTFPKGYSYGFNKVGTVSKYVRAAKSCEEVAKNYPEKAKESKDAAAKFNEAAKNAKISGATEIVKTTAKYGAEAIATVTSPTPTNVIKMFTKIIAEETTDALKIASEKEAEKIKECRAPDKNESKNGSKNKPTANGEENSNDGTEEDGGDDNSSDNQKEPSIEKNSNIKANQSPQESISKNWNLQLYSMLQAENNDPNENSILNKTKDQFLLLAEELVGDEKGAKTRGKVTDAEFLANWFAYSLWIENKNLSRLSSHLTAFAMISELQHTVLSLGTTFSEEKANQNVESLISANKPYIQFSNEIDASALEIGNSIFRNEEI